MILLYATDFRRRVYVLERGVEEAVAAAKKEVCPDCWDFVWEPVDVEGVEPALYVAEGELQAVRPLSDSTREALQTWQRCHPRAAYEKYVPYLPSSLRDLFGDYELYVVKRPQPLYLVRGLKCYGDIYKMFNAVRAPIYFSNRYMLDVRVPELAVVPFGIISRSGTSEGEKTYVAERVDAVPFAVLLDVPPGLAVLAEIVGMGLDQIDGRYVYPVYAADVPPKAKAAVQLHNALLERLGDEPFEVPRRYYFQILMYHPRPRFRMGDYVLSMHYVVRGGVIELWIAIDDKNKGIFIGKSGRSIKEFEQRLGVKVRVI